MEKQHEKVKRREETFVQRTATRIWHETPSPDNPYLTAVCSCHGYDLLELMKHRNYVDVFYLLFRGELPTPEEARRLEALMMAFINPGPRHPATRAAMCAGVGKTDSVQILPIALTVLGGNFCAGEIEESMRFLRKEGKKNPCQIATDLVTQTIPSCKGDHHVVAGFGSQFGGIDPLLQNIADFLLNLPGGTSHLSWANAFVQVLQPYGFGWLPSGLAAAVFSDLGFQPRFGPALFQLLCAPGLLAHGLEISNKPLTAMPFIKDEDYIIER